MTTVLLDNRYKILQTLGRGGFGQTFLAIDTHMPSGRQCVIKQLHPAKPDAGMEQWVRERFQKEAAILEQLGEKNSQIPRLYAYFSEGENFYLVQEWIPGMTLREKQQQGNLSSEEVKEILLGILPVIAYIHGVNIIHRDIKPDNIILRTGDNRPVLIDFGAVKEAMNTIMNGNNRPSYLSVAIGTPGYMPSEQAAGRPLYSSDLYSLGMTAVFLLTGKDPQDLNTNASNGEILWQEISQNVDPELVEIIDRAIQFHPRDRFSSALEMQSALEGVRARNSSTTATVVVAPNRTQNGTRAKEESPTKVARMESSPKKKRSTFLLPLVSIAIIGLGSFVLGFNFLKNQLARSPVDNDLPQSPNISDSNSEPAIDNPSPDFELPSEPEPVPQEEAPAIFVDPVLEPSNSDSESNSPISRERPIEVPPFAVGTPKERVISILGQPTSDKKGYWPNSRALLYKDYVPNRIDLGYLYDANTGRLRQTETTFAASVSIEVMNKTLNNFLKGNFGSSEQYALEQVYRKETDMRSFDTGNLKVLIKRDRKDSSIYIAVWEKDFH